MLTDLEIKEYSDQKREIGVLSRQYIALHSRDMETINSLPDTPTKIAALIYFSLYNGKQTARDISKKSNGHRNRKIFYILRCKEHHTTNITEIDDYVQNPSTPEITWIQNDMNVILFEYTGFIERLIWSSRLRFKCKQNMNVAEPTVTKQPFTDEPEKIKFDIHSGMKNESI